MSNLDVTAHQSVAIAPSARIGAIDSAMTALATYTVQATPRRPKQGSKLAGRLDHHRPVAHQERDGCNPLPEPPNLSRLGFREAQLLGGQRPLDPSWLV